MKNTRSLPSRKCTTSPYVAARRRNNFSGTRPGLMSAPNIGRRGPGGRSAGLGGASTREVLIAMIGPLRLSAVDEGGQAPAQSGGPAHPLIGNDDRLARRSRVDQPFTF